jgi:hypothetical protein
MIPLIPPVPKEELEAELGHEKRILRFRGIEVFALVGEEAPRTMLEIGRIREKEFRAVGAGRNVAADIDDLDTGPGAYRQLIAWDPEHRELVAAYRYMLCGDRKEGPLSERLRTARLFDYSERFVRDYLPYSVELGRSVVNREARRAVMGLFTVWSGLGALVSEYRDLRYFFGTISVYTIYPRRAIEQLLRFLERDYADREGLLRPRAGLEWDCSPSSTFPFTGDKAADQAALLAGFSASGLVVPPILLSYLGATDDLRYLATARDADFGDALECALLVPFASVNGKTRARFLDGYESVNPQRFRDLRS